MLLRVCARACEYNEEVLQCLPQTTFGTSGNFTLCSLEKENCQLTNMLPSLEMILEQFWSFGVISDEDKTFQPEMETDWGEKDSVKPPYKPWAAEIDTAVIGLDCISNTLSLAKKKIAKKQKKD